MLAVNAEALTLVESRQFELQETFQRFQVPRSAVVSVQHSTQKAGFFGPHAAFVAGEKEN